MQNFGGTNQVYYGIFENGLFKDPSLQSYHNCYFKHTNVQLKPTLKRAVGFVFGRKKFLPSFLLSGPTNKNRIFTFQDVPVDLCGYVSMPIHYYFSYQSTLFSLVIELSTVPPFVAIPKIHWG